MSGTWKRGPRLYLEGYKMETATSRYLTREDKTRADHRLETFGLRLGSGSLEENKLNAFVVPLTCSVTYNGTRVAKALMDEFQVEETVIDGRLYIREEVERDLKIWTNRRPLYY